MKSKLSLSVAIATWNSAQTIERCLDSLMPYLHDGYIDEIIVVEGHSTDQTAEIVRSYQVKLIFEEGMESWQSSIIRSHYSTFNAFNMGWKACHTDLLMFLDSDAYLGENFFPYALNYFENTKLGILGCWPKAWITNDFTRTIGEVWQFHGERISALQKQSPNIFEKVYQFAAWRGNKVALTSGPCYIARRECLEAVGGHDILADLGLCLHIMEAGWASQWWTEAPVYHFPPQRLSQLWHQRYHWGEDGAFRPFEGWRNILSQPLRIIGAAGLGIFLAVRFRNRRHLLGLPTAELGHFFGYIAGKIARARGKT